MEDAKFGDELSMDLMFLNGKAVLHIIDTATRFSAATFLDAHGSSYGQSVDGIWLAFSETWYTLYTGYPNRLRVDKFHAPREHVERFWKFRTYFRKFGCCVLGVRLRGSFGALVVSVGGLRGLRGSCACLYNSPSLRGRPL